LGDALEEVDGGEAIEEMDNGAVCPWLVAWLL